MGLITKLYQSDEMVKSYQKELSAYEQKLKSYDKGLHAYEERLSKFDKKLEEYSKENPIDNMSLVQMAMDITYLKEQQNSISATLEATEELRTDMNDKVNAMVGPIFKQNRRLKFGVVLLGILNVMTLIGLVFLILYEMDMLSGLI